MATVILKPIIVVFSVLVVSFVNNEHSKKAHRSTPSVQNDDASSFTKKILIPTLYGHEVFSHTLSMMSTPLTTCQKKSSTLPPLSAASETRIDEWVGIIDDVRCW